MTLLAVILLPLLAGTTLCLAVSRHGRSAAAWTAAAVTAAGLALVLLEAPGIIAGHTLIASWQWMPELGLNLSFRLDGLGLMFSLLILGIGLLVILYARYYLFESDPAGRFYSLLMLFMAAMLGVVLTENLLLLVIFWELTSLSSFLLIAYWSHSAEARRGGHAWRSRLPALAGLLCWRESC